MCSLYTVNVENGQAVASFQTPSAAYSLWENFHISDRNVFGEKPPFLDTS